MNLLNSRQNLAELQYANRVNFPLPLVYKRAYRL